MKIPMPQGGVKSAGIPTPYANTNTQGAFGAAYTGAVDKIQNASDNVQVAMSRADAEAERAAKEARAKADAISAANADADYQRAETAGLVGRTNRRELIDQAFEGAADPSREDVQETPGYLSTRGKEAYEKSAGVIDDIEKQRQEIAKAHFSDAGARERWLARSNGMLADTERKVESHAAKQFEVARTDALEGVRSSALDGIANATDSASVGAIAERTEQRIRELQVSEEGGTADVAKFRRDAVTVRIGRMLADGDVEHAEVQYELAKSALGVNAEKVKAQIDQAKKAQGVRSHDIEAEKQAAAMVESAVLPSGKLDAEKAAGLVEQVPPGPLRDEIRQRLEHRLVVKEKQWNQRVSKVYDGAFSTYLKTNSLNAVDPKAKSWLIENAPEEWAKLKAKERSDAEYWRRLREHKPGETEEQREQLIALKADMAERPDYYRDLTPEQFFGEDLAQGLSPPGLSQAGTIFAATKKEDPIKVGEFKTFVDDEINGSELRDKKKDRASFRAHMSQRRQEFVAKNKREPDYEERQAMADEAWKKQASGSWYKSDQPAFKKPYVAPSMTFDEGLDLTAEKQVVGYKVSPDKKSRAPKYADGTFGPIEAVP